MERTTWQTDTVTITPTKDIAHVRFYVTGSSYEPITRGAVLLDNLRTLTGIALKQADGTAQADGKVFRLLWQPILTAGGLDSLAQPQLRGTVRTFWGGRVPLPAKLQITEAEAKGFYFFQEATPAAGQDTTYYGLYVRNTPLADGVKDDTLRHLYQCGRTYGSQAGLLSDSLAPLALGSLRRASAQRVAHPLVLRPAVRTSLFPATPRGGLAYRVAAGPARPPAAGAPAAFIRALPRVG
ncbi:hypothetical protein IC235_02980 [Hymenobacter sp. BT664]|uniref:Uncharacterized protein n=1 Tax=Hymenobacter montanus TaxID=2771359 RepID=A0A927GI84_9BACT|nr:hypothetical protein [Hymenobacter montanus]MBD2766854.1 hypothetical protein [Hymenobacter montanus]